VFTTTSKIGSDLCVKFCEGENYYTLREEAGDVPSDRDFALDYKCFLATGELPQNNKIISDLSNFRELLRQESF